MENDLGRRWSSGNRSAQERVLATLKHALAEGHYEESMLPSYRQLARELNVSKASIQRAMDRLESEGLIRRENGRGVLARVQSPLPTSHKQTLQCINFVMPPSGRTPSFVEADYLAGYTRLLEHVAIRMRFVRNDEPTCRYDHLFSQTVPLEAQGVIIVNMCPPILLEWLRRDGVPFVVQYHTRYAIEHLPPHSGIYVNKPGGASQAVEHLLELGHHRIGFMGYADLSGMHPPDMSAPGLAFQGYRAALISAGLDCPRNGFIPYGEKEQKREGFSVAKAFLARPERPTAIVAQCDEYAQSLLDAAHALNIRVPEELSIVGINNQPESMQTSPPLTTISVPRCELAQSAVEMLMNVSANPDAPPRMRILDTHLIIRGTTAPPRAEHA